MKKKIWLSLFLYCLFITPIQSNTRENVTLTKCTDGDTAHFMLNGKDTTVRFLAINAPENTKRVEKYGKQASELTCELLRNAKEIQLEFDDGSDLIDAYGRTLAWVFVDGNLLAKELVSQGLAEVKYIYGDYAYTEELRMLEKEAKQKKLNMWSGETPEEETLPTYIAMIGGMCLILIAVFFVRGKGKKKKMIKKGLRQLRR